MVEIVKGAAGVRQERLVFEYDPFNRRMRKTAYTWDGSGWGTPRHEFYLYDGQNEIGAAEEGDPGPGYTLTQFRVLGQGLGAEIGAAVAVELLQPSDETRICVPIHDHRVNVVMLLLNVIPILSTTTVVLLP